MYSLMKGKLDFGSLWLRINKHKKLKKKLFSTIHNLEIISCGINYQQYILFETNAEGLYITYKYEH
jgi:hypothetical protein